MKMEFAIVSRVMASHDFFEGVRALIIDKDKSPVWAPATLGDVDDKAIEAYFEPLASGELVLE
jgi:enoyl-CoA hydratase